MNTTRGSGHTTNSQEREIGKNCYFLLYFYSLDFVIHPLQHAKIICFFSLLFPPR